MSNSDNNIKQSSKKGNILCVDDDRILVKLLQRILESAYNVESATSGEMGLDILKNGFKPGVIISDQIMPYMTGSEFLARTIDIVPDAARIILTGGDNPKDIIASINQAHAFMYLTKPCSNLQLFQAAKLGFDHYFNQEKNKKIIDEANAKFQLEKEYFKTVIKKNEALSESINKLTEEKNDALNKLNEQNSLIDSYSSEIQEYKATIEDYQKNTEDLKEKNENYLKLIYDNKEYPNQSILAFSGLLREFERYYFTEHTGNVTTIVKSLADDLKLDSDVTTTAIAASLLHNIVLIGMPDRLKSSDPTELDDDVRRSYFEYFNRAINYLLTVKLLHKQAIIISQLWEHIDGSGYPQGLKGNQILKEAQMITMANIYHNKVYKVPKENIELLLTNDPIEQDYDETMRRHKESINYFYKKVNWFNVDVFHSFQDLIKNKSCPVLIPENKFYKIIGNERMELTPEEIRAIAKKDEGKESSDKKDIVGSKEKKVEQPKIRTGRLITREIYSSEVRAGMQATENIVTINGVVAVHKNIELKPNDVKRVKQLASHGLIDERITVQMPYDMVI